MKKYSVPALIVMAFAIILLVSLVASYWVVIWGLIWTTAVAWLLAYATFHLLRVLRSGTGGASTSRFSYGWALTLSVIVFLVVWTIGWGITTLAWHSHVRRIQQQQQHQPQQQQQYYQPNSTPTSSGVGVLLTKSRF